VYGFEQARYKYVLFLIEAKINEDMLIGREMEGAIMGLLKQYPFQVRSNFT
jgi:hypothetical protein